jgi:hypothetical protein
VGLDWCTKKGGSAPAFLPTRELSSVARRPPSIVFCVVDIPGFCTVESLLTPHSQNSISSISSSILVDTDRLDVDAYQQPLRARRLDEAPG